MSAAFTVLAVLRAGAKPVFCDLEEKTLNIDPAKVLPALSEKTRALLPVHLYGHPVDLDPFLKLGTDRGIPVIEDACQAHGALYKGRPVGAISGLGALSFYPTKNVGAFGDGGAILAQDGKTASLLRRLRNGGQTDRYHHEGIGMNSRLDEIQAAILRVKLKHLPAFVERRRALASIYLERLSGVGLVLPEEQGYARAAYHLFVVRHPRRDALQAALKTRGIQTLIHYPIPLHLQPAFAGLGHRPGDFPVAERAAKEILSLPLYPELSDDQVLYVAESVRELAPALM
jgi:dTDP-4-amino-4,6-dideoxygalactose transaminase